MIDAHVMIQLK